MSSTASCVHCLGPIRPPGLWSSSWQCDDHGATLPFFAAAVPSAGVLDRLRASATVPIWVPQPLPTGWCVSAIGWVGDERTGARATAIGCCGPSPLGGAAEAVFVAEEPGVGLAARLAGLPAAALSAGEGPGEAKLTGGPPSDPAVGASRRDQRARGLRGGGPRGLAGARLLAVDRQPAADRAHAAGRPRATSRRVLSEYAGLIFGAPSGRLSKRTADVLERRAQTAPAGARPASDSGP